MSNSRRATETAEMMAKFNRLNDEYKNIAEKQLHLMSLEKNNVESSDVIDPVLNFKEENVFNMIRRANDDIKFLRNNIAKLTNIVNEYTSYKNEIASLLNDINKVSETYYQLSTKTQIIPITPKLEIKSQLVESHIKEQLIYIKNGLDVEISEKNDEIINCNKKISAFKKMVKQCMSEENAENNLNIGKNICSICATHKINTCLNPCGHTFCIKCVDKMNQRCGMCRTQFISKIKMFIADDDEADEESDEESEDVGRDNNSIEPYVAGSGFQFDHIHSSSASSLPPPGGPFSSASGSFRTPGGGVGVIVASSAVSTGSTRTAGTTGSTGFTGSATERIMSLFEFS
jgi:hypothetical protein